MSVALLNYTVAGINIWNTSTKDNSPQRSLQQWYGSGEVDGFS
ncbi:MAG: hypothetical protein V7L14_23590 [Nostoc sp.]